MTPSGLKSWAEVIAEVVQNPMAVLLLLALLVALFSWLVVRFYLRDHACRVSQAKLEVMLGFLWGMLGQDERYAGRLPSFQHVKEGKVDLDQWLASPVWIRQPADRRHNPRS